ncbi:MAG: hypothetical protein ACFB2Y_02665 [Fulvivirga sp.]
MTEGKLKSSLGVYLILVHFLTILLVFTYFIIEWYNLEIMQSALVIIVPLFANLTAIVIKKIIQDEFPTGNVVSKSRVFVSFFIPSVFFIVLLMVLTKQAIRPFLNLENFTATLGVVETAFAVNIGYIVRKFFDK